MRHRRPLLVVRSRQVPVAGIARTDRVCVVPGSARWPRVQASLGINRQGNPPRPAITSQLAASTRRPIQFRPRHRLHAFPSLCWDRAQGRARTPRRPTGSGRSHRAPWGNARRSTAPAPQSEPVTQASRLVALNAPSVASRFGVRILAAGPAHLRLYSDRRGFLCADPNKVWSDSPIQRMRPYSPRANRLRARRRS
jgi:hypothetical protein